MKASIIILILSVLITASSYANNSAAAEIKIQKQMSQIELNLLNGLNSENEGLKFSCAYYLGEYKCSNAVIPLLSMLRENNDECSRIMAALALAKIGDQRGLYALKRVYEIEGPTRLGRLCNLFYQNHYAKK